MMKSRHPHRTWFAREPRSAFFACAVLLGIFACISWSAVKTKNATIDEPGHALSGWLMLHYGDFRLAPENPSLWQIWAALPNLERKMVVHFNADIFRDKSFDSQGGIDWVSQTLYHTPGNDGEALVRRSRAMMLIIGVTLGAVIGLWAFQLAGRTAAILAVALFCFDPNFLAHSPIVKSDVSFSLLMLAMAIIIWRLGQRITLLRVVLAGLLCAAGMNAKFSGLLLPPMAVLLLLIRAVLPMPWATGDRQLSTAASRLLAVAAISTIVICACFCITWAAYGFRFRPADSPSSTIDMSAIRQRTLVLEAAADQLTGQLNHSPSLIVRAVDFANAHHLLPQAMLGGLLYQHACLQLWPSYLLGRLYGIGPWYYFPLAMLWKTPLATLVIFGVTLLVFTRRIMVQASLLKSTSLVWSIVCLLLPLALFGFAALRSHLQIGIRSILPLYPFLFVGCGVALSSLVHRNRKGSSLLVVLLVAGIILESCSAFPNFISFFNAGAGGSRGGFALLGDSNLDWGQDLSELVRWQQRNPQVPVYLHYCGTTDPAFLALRYHDVQVTPDGGALVSDVPMQPGVLAVSTNYLQGLLDTKTNREYFRSLAQRPPDEVVGGSIYLYRYPLR